MEDKIIAEIDLGEIIEVKAIREVGVCQMIGNVEVTTEEKTKMLATIDQGQVLE